MQLCWKQSANISFNAPETKRLKGARWRERRGKEQKAKMQAWPDENSKTIEENDVFW